VTDRDDGRLANAREALKTRLRTCGLNPDRTVLDALDAYYLLLARWTKRINLTSLPLEAPTDATFDRLFIEPLFAADRLVPTEAVWFDFGSGGGSPAIPMKIWRSRSWLAMVESKSRKAAFLREAVRQLQLKNVEVLEKRFEVLADAARPIGPADLVTVRAVRPSVAVFQAANDVLSPTGRIIIFGDAHVEQPVNFTPPEIVRFPTGTVQVFQKTDVPRGTKDLT